MNDAIALRGKSVDQAAGGSWLERVHSITFLGAAPRFDAAYVNQTGFDRLSTVRRTHPLTGCLHGLGSIQL